MCFLLQIFFSLKLNNELQNVIIARNVKLNGSKIVYKKCQKMPKKNNKQNIKK